MIDLLTERREWVLIPIVFFLTTILMTLPVNLLTTFESPRFVTYMGAPESDIRAALQFSDQVDSDRVQMLDAMRSDPQISEVRVFAQVLYETPGEEGWENLRVEVGDYSTGSSIEYLSGGAPRDGELALSVLNADKYGIGAGDRFEIRQGGEVTPVIVSGVYQDVTSGGHTAKLQGEVDSGALGYVIYAVAAADVDIATLATEYDEEFTSASVIPVTEFLQQTLSYVTSAFRSAAVLSVLFSVGVAVLVTSLFLRLRFARDKGKHGLLAALGFSASELIAQSTLKVLSMVAAGVVAGVIFSSTLGEAMVGGLISLAGLGIEDIEFISSPLTIYGLFPILLSGAGYIGVAIHSFKLRDGNKSAWLRE